jgi:hypothetical protein
MKIFRWTKRLFLTLAFLALIATNVLTLTSSAVNAALSGLLSAKLGVQTVSETLRGKLDASKRTIKGKDKTIKAKNKTIKKNAATHAKHKAATKRFGARLAGRTKRVAAASVAAIPGETIPLIGTTLLIVGTSYELYAACDNMKDLDELYTDMGMMDEVPDDVLHSVCDPSLPYVGNFWNGTIKKGRSWLGAAGNFWGGTIKKGKRWWSKAYGFVIPRLSLPGYLSNFRDLSPPDK